MANLKSKIKASTQEHLDIDDITDDLVMMKNGWMAMVLSTTAVNFDILSEAEQDATIYAYGALLNSLTFPLQVLIRSKKADITAYYQHILEAEKSQPNPDLRLQIRKYREFIQSTVQQKTILDKRFYLVVHFSPLELGVKSFKKTNTKSAKNKADLVGEAKAALSPKRDHLVKQTARLGLFTKQLNTQELVELFYDIYNPAPTGTQRVILDATSYTTPLVEPDLEVPTPAPVAGIVPQASSVLPAGGEMTAPQMAVPPVLKETPAEKEIILPVVESKAGQASPLVVPPTAIGMQTPGAISGAVSAQQEALKNLQDAVKRATGMAGVGSVDNTKKGGI